MAAPYSADRDGGSGMNLFQIYHLGVPPCTALRRASAPGGGLCDWSKHTSHALGAMLSSVKTSCEVEQSAT